jgi:hypothetical protein
LKMDFGRTPLRVRGGSSAPRKSLVGPASRVGCGSIVEQPARIEQALDLCALNPRADRTVRTANTDESARLRTCVAGQVLPSSEPLMARSGHRRASLSKPAARAARLDRGCSGVPLPLEQLPLLACGVPTEARLGQTLRPFALRALERRKTTSNRFSVDAELLGDLDLVLARANAPAIRFTSAADSFGRGATPRVYVRGTFRGTYRVERQRQPIQAQPL